MRNVIWALAMLALGYLFGGVFIRQLVLCFTANIPLIRRLQAVDAIERSYAQRRNLLYVVIWAFLSLLFGAAAVFYSHLYCGLWAPLVFSAAAIAALLLKLGHYGPGDDSLVLAFLGTFIRCLVDKNLIYYIRQGNDRQTLVVYHRLTDGEVQD